MALTRLDYDLAPPLPGAADGDQQVALLRRGAVPHLARAAVVHLHRDGPARARCREHTCLIR